MPYTPYTPTWTNPYMPINGPSSALGQSVIPAQQMQLANGWQQPVNGVIKVNGRDSAMQYNLPPNSTSPALFDQSGTCFYIVTTDGTGTKSVECFDFSPHVEQQPVQIDGAQFVSRQEFEDFTAKVNAALGALNGVHEPVPTAGTAASDEGTNVAAPLHATGGHVGSGQQSRAV